jgi:hypothetical protein
MNTMQQEFDAVCQHLMTQRVAAVRTDGNGCAYRGANGTSCAVGCRIPDSMYNPDIEGLRVGALLSDFNVPAEVLEYLPMFTRLQSIHDFAMPRVYQGGLISCCRSSTQICAKGWTEYAGMCIAGD